MFINLLNEWQAKYLIKSRDTHLTNREIGLLEEFASWLDSRDPTLLPPEHSQNLPEGHSGSSLECMHPFCVAERAGGRLTERR